MEEMNEITRICAVCGKEKSINSYVVNGRNGYRHKICKVCVSMGLTRKDLAPPKETKKCPACEVTKPINQFYRNNSLITGYEPRCKVCKNNRISSRVKGEPKQKSSAEPIMSLVGLSKEDFRKTYLFLQAIGYNLSGDKSIHEQFCLKYNLPVNPEPYNTKYYFSPKYFGLA